MRFLSPILFAAAAGWTAWYNAQHTDRAMVLPGMELLDPAAANDLALQGTLTVRVLAALAVVLGLREGYRWWRDRGDSDGAG